MLSLKYTSTPRSMSSRTVQFLVILRTHKISMFIYLSMIMPNKIFVEMLFDNGICKLVKQGCSGSIMGQFNKKQSPQARCPINSYAF